MEVSTVFPGEEGTWAASYTALWAPSGHHQMGQTLPPLSCREQMGLLLVSLGHLQAVAAPSLHGKGEGGGIFTSASFP